MFKMAPLLSSLLAFDFPSSGDVGENTFPNCMSEILRVNILSKRTVKSEHSIENHKLSNQLTMIETFIEIQRKQANQFFRKLYKTPSSRSYTSFYFYFFNFYVSFLVACEVFYKKVNVSYEL